jgi:UDP-N-acetylmuramoyl-tripeptide--D-alanyl-D-alanine ligase
MVELGSEQEHLNREFGKYLADKVDVAIVVGAYNREAIVSGLKEGGIAEEKLHIVESFNEAQKVLGGIMQKGDTVLYENDLPDTFK